MFLFSFSVLTRQYFFSYLSDSSHTLNHIFLLPQSAVWPNRAFGSPTQFPFIIFDLQPPLLASPVATPLFAVSSASSTMESPRLLPHFPSENGRTPSPLLPRFHLS
jgi:hypothetical protein